MAQLTCGYRNTRDRMVILRCLGPEQFFLERVVFPFELLSFACPPQSEVKIWTHGLGGPDLVETINAEELLLDVPPPPAPLEALSGGGSSSTQSSGHRQHEQPWAAAG